MRNINQVIVFISGPNDVADEMRAIKQAVLGWNNRFSNSRVLFSPFVWFDDIIPSIASDTQAVINNQLPDYDIFIGVLWSRVGAATPRYASGTVEEYHNAVVKNRDNNAVKLAVYFKQNPIPPNILDGGQWTSLQAFKVEIGTTQFYKTFLSTDELTQNVERLLDGFSSDNGEPLSLNTQEIIVGTIYEPEVLALDEEVGFAEAESDFLVTARDITDFMNFVGMTFSKLNSITSSANERLGTLSLSGDTELSSRKPVIDNLSLLMDEITLALQNRLKSSFPIILKFNTQTAIYFDLIGDFNHKTKDLDDLEFTIKDAMAATMTASDSLLGVTESLIGIPRLTTKFRKSRSGLISTIASLDSYYKVALNSFQTAITEVTRLRGELPRQIEA